MTKLKHIAHRHIHGEVPIAPLVSFRILFGLVMFISIIRFALKGWIAELYIQPAIHFPYYGLEWVKPLTSWGMYGLFGVMALAAVGIMLGAFYRTSTWLFFLAFTYVELIDKATYLNHYYFVSIISFLLIFLPANRYFSVDVALHPHRKHDVVPAWCINILKLQLGIVYFFAGVAKVNYDWLMRAMPLKIWLPAKAHVPVVGGLLKSSWAAYAFSWAGALYDLSIPFLLLIKKTRPLAYAAVVGFHLITGWLFPIGMFPYIMIALTTIFFPAIYHQKALTFLRKITGISSPQSKATWQPAPVFNKVVLSILALHFVIQILLPLRHLAYPGDLFWHEEGYRFSWRVMLMEKVGSATFQVVDQTNNRMAVIHNEDYLTPLQEKMMATQPDMILQYAHHLGNTYQQKGWENPEVYVTSRVTVQGRKHQTFVSPKVDLMKQSAGWHHKDWLASPNWENRQKKRLAKQ